MLTVSDDYLVGFVEGEGMFYVGIVPSCGTSRNRSGWQVIYFFKVSQNPNGKVILDLLKKRLGCGYVKANSKTDNTDKSLAFVVRDLPSVRNRVIPFFNDRLVIKKKNFERFKRVIELVSLGKHTTKDGMRDILDLAYAMNTGKRKVLKERILAGYKN